MMISKIPIPQNTYLVIIVTDKNNHSNHTVYFLNQYGNLVEDGVKIYDSNLYEISSLIHHMMKIHFTSDITEHIPNISNLFNRLDENQEVDYDDRFYWQLTPRAVEICRRYCKLEQVLNYKDTLECRKEEHIISDWISEGNSEETLKMIEKSVV